jgi:hypothetical protein
VIGANAVVLKSVPARAFAVGVPATVKENRGSFDVVIYEDMESDPSRRASLRCAETVVGVELHAVDAIDLDHVGI